MNRKAIVIGFNANAVVVWTLAVKRKEDKKYKPLKGRSQQIDYLPPNLVDREEIYVGAFVYWQTTLSDGYGDVKVNLIRRGYNFEAGLHYRKYAEQRVIEERLGALRSC